MVARVALGANAASLGDGCPGGVLRPTPSDTPAAKITTAAAACAHAGSGARHHAILGSSTLAGWSAAGPTSWARVIWKPSAISGGVHAASVRRVAPNVSISLAQAVQAHGAVMEPGAYGKMVLIPEA